MEKDDLRYEVISHIIAMVEDDIQVRLDLNSKVEAINELNNRKLESLQAPPRKTTPGETTRGGFFTPGEPLGLEKRKSIKGLQLNESMTSEPTDEGTRPKKNKMFRMCS